TAAIALATLRALTFSLQQDGAAQEAQPQNALDADGDGPTEIIGIMVYANVAPPANCAVWAPFYLAFGRSGSNSPPKVFGQTSHRIEDPSMEGYSHVNGDCIVMMGVTYLTGFGWMYCWCETMTRNFADDFLSLSTQTRDCHAQAFSDPPAVRYQGKRREGLLCLRLSSTKEKCSLVKRRFPSCKGTESNPRWK
ncbi:hypothetical protein CTA2_7001, partial [Colletotrichum tanaceti]